MAIIVARGRLQLGQNGRIVTARIPIDAKTSRISLRILKPTLTNGVVWRPNSRIKTYLRIRADAADHLAGGSGSGGPPPIANDPRDDPPSDEYSLNWSPTYGFFGDRSGVTRRLGEGKTTYDLLVELDLRGPAVDTIWIVDTEIADAPQRTFHSSVVFDDVSQGDEQSGDDVVTVSHVAGGDDRGVFIGVGGANTGNGSLTYGGVAADELWDIVNDAQSGAGYFTSVEPASSAQDVVSTLTGGSPGSHNVQVCSFQGVDTGDPTGSPDTDQGDTMNDATTTVATPASDSIVVAHISSRPNHADPGYGADQVEQIWRHTSWSVETAISTKLGSFGSGLNTWAFQGGTTYQDMVFGAVEVKAVAGGDMVAAGSLSITGLATINAPGEIVAAGALAIAGLADLDAVGDLVAAGGLSITGTADADAAGEMVAAGSLAIVGSADLDAIGALLAAGSVAIVGTAALDAAGEMVAAGSVAITGIADLNALGALIAAGSLAITGVADLAGLDDIIAAGSLAITGVADLDAVGALIAAGSLTIVGAADLAGLNDMFAAGSLAIVGTADLDAVGALLMSGSLAIVGSADLDAIGALLAAGSLAITGAAQLDGLNALFASGSVVIVGTADLDAAGALLATGSLGIAGAAGLDASGELVAAGLVAIDGSADLDAIGALVAAGSLSIIGTADLDALGDLLAAGLLAITGVASLTDANLVLTFRRGRTATAAVLDRSVTGAPKARDAMALPKGRDNR